MVGEVRTFHSNNDINCILVLHFVDIDDYARPLPVVLHNILVQLALELFNKFKGSVVRDR